MKTEYKECASCQAKLGAAYLCDVCLHNRAAFHLLNRKIKDLQEEVSFFRAIVKRLVGKNND